MRILSTLLSCVLMLMAGVAHAALTSGERAPDFSGETATGESVSLSDFAGKTVVLEWSNHGCPFVKKHYGSGNMQALQKAATEDGVVWLTIISSADGKQGHVSGDEALNIAKESGAVPTHIILDEDGKIGKLYDAKTTPHLFVISPNGTLAYQGAIDSIASPDPADIANATNYVSAALASIKANETVAMATTKPYGCGIKY